MATPSCLILPNFHQSSSISTPNYHKLESLEQPGQNFLLLQLTTDDEKAMDIEQMMQFNQTCKYVFFHSSLVH
ncbi:hypothetical protein HanPSC8_Chr10g0418041 [Helianthus annuus]|nr:hypothetical protein HanPSC8_Chr10g0418041 [Helianthus annuus]